ncbi:MAG: hypothetical protein LBU75_14960 [Desulfovibrio sp.]|jgi:hypothetical protein|nr:hypothetical protein [Desulfovibrio sp.]
MRIDQFTGGAEGILNVLEQTRLMQQDGQQLAGIQADALPRQERRDAGQTQTESSVAVRGLGEHVDVTV